MVAAGVVAACLEGSFWHGQFLDGAEGRGEAVLFGCHLHVQVVQLTHFALSIEEIGSLQSKNSISAALYSAFNMILTSPNPTPRTHIPHIITLLLLVSLTSSVRVELTPTEPSISLDFETDGKHTLYVVSSGSDNHQVQLLVKVRGMVQFNKTGTDLEYASNFGAGNISAQITSTDAQHRSVSFDFYSDEDPFIKVIDKKDMAVLEGMLSHVHRTMQTISVNQKFHIERDEAHKITLQESESHIKWTGIVKIVFLLTSALVQLWIMKGFFKNSGGQSYHPVQGSEA